MHNRCIKLIKLISSIAFIGLFTQIRAPNELNNRDLARAVVLSAIAKEQGQLVIQLSSLSAPIPPFCPTRTEYNRREFMSIFKKIKEHVAEKTGCHPSMISLTHKERGLLDGAGFILLLGEELETKKPHINLEFLTQQTMESVLPKLKAAGGDFEGPDTPDEVVRMCFASRFVFKHPDQDTIELIIGLFGGITQQAIEHGQKIKASIVDLFVDAVETIRNTERDGHDERDYDVRAIPKDLEIGEWRCDFHQDPSNENIVIIIGRSTGGMIGHLAYLPDPLCTRKNLAKVLFAQRFVPKVLEILDDMMVK